MPFPRVSVVIPAYNAAPTLTLCLQSLAGSEVAPFETFVVDDGSSDDTAEIARRFGATVLTTGGRKGPAHARNLGARAATGEVLFFFDSDVCIRCGTISRI